MKNEIIKFIMLNTIAPTNADQKSAISKPVTSFETAISKNALIKKVKIPIVRMLIGKVRKISTGLIIAFSIPRSITASIRDDKPLISIPFTNHAVTQSATPFTINLITKKISKFYLLF